MKSGLNTSVLSAVVASLSLVAVSQAAIIVQYGFGANGTTLTPTTEHADVTGGTLSTQGFTSSANTSTIASPGTATGVGTRQGSSMNASFSANDKYWAFTITPDAGKTIDFTEISFYYNRGDGNSADEWRLRSSANSYATDLVGLTAMTGTDNTAPLTFTFTNKSISLTGITAATTFRLYTYSAAGSGSVLRVDDITLSGTVVPEPVSAGVLAAGSMMLLRRRR